MRKPIWREIEEFPGIARKLVAKRPGVFGHVDPCQIVAYGCVNKDRPELYTRVYDMTGVAEPECFSCSKRYFVKMFMSDWEALPENNRIALVASALLRMDPARPGIIAQRDEATLVRVLGPNWWSNPLIPNLLTDSVEFHHR